jgi:hypothetical protein
MMNALAFLSGMIVSVTLLILLTGWAIGAWR